MVASYFIIPYTGISTVRIFVVNWHNVESIRTHPMLLPLENTAELAEGDSQLLEAVKLTGFFKKK